MYTHTNFKTKKELKAAVDKYNGLAKDGKFDGMAAARVTYFQPGPFGGDGPQDGRIFVEGPHYPEPHKWYAECQVVAGAIVRVK